MVKVRNRLLAVGLFVVVTASEARAQQLTIPFASAYITAAETSDPDEVQEPEQWPLAAEDSRGDELRAKVHRYARIAALPLVTAGTALGHCFGALFRGR